MIFGDNTMIHFDGAGYVRFAEFGKLFDIAEKMGMDKKNIQILAESVEAFQFDIEKAMYSSVKRGIPVEEEPKEFKLSPEFTKSLHAIMLDEVYKRNKNG